MNKSILIQIINRGEWVELRSPYDKALVADIKNNIEAADRTFDPLTKSWVVDIAHVSLLTQIAQRHGKVIHSTNLVDPNKKETARLRVEYVGLPRMRGNNGKGNRISFALVNGNWTYAIPEPVLEEFFLPKDTPELYHLLGIRRTADSLDVKKAYRKMSMLWHPDVSKESDAKEMFLRLKIAYDILSDDAQRRKYLAAFDLIKASQNNQQQDLEKIILPYRCGMVTVEYKTGFGIRIVSRILKWEDILDGRGRAMVASWVPGASKPHVRWVERPGSIIS